MGIGDSDGLVASLRQVLRYCTPSHTAESYVKLRALHARVTSPGRDPADGEIRDRQATTQVVVWRSETQAAGGEPETWVTVLRAMDQDCTRDRRGWTVVWPMVPPPRAAGKRL
jgi:hypothetical protein